MSDLSLIPQSIDDLTRVEKLEIYMKRSKITFSDISKPMGVAPASARRMLLNETIPTWRHKQLIQYGLPEVLLPIARDIPCGRKPKTKTPSVETDEPNRLGQAA